MDNLISMAIHKMERGYTVDEVRRWLDDSANKRMITWDEASKVLIFVNQNGTTPPFGKLDERR